MRSTIWRAQSHVTVSFETPEYTANADALGHVAAARGHSHPGTREEDPLLPGLHLRNVGKVQEIPQKETTPFHPRSPYGAAKVYAYWITVNYREAYGMYACNGILFNHESPIRGETFVTRKITRGLARVKMGLQDMPVPRQSRRQAGLGPCARLRRRQWLMLQQGQPEDYVIATGRSSIRSGNSSKRRRANWVCDRMAGRGLEREGH